MSYEQSVSEHYTHGGLVGAIEASLAELGKNINSVTIEDKAGLFAEVHRAMRPGAHFAVYDVMRINDGELTYPVPWATEEHTSQLATPKQYRKTLEQAGFEISDENVRRAFAVEFFKQMREKTEAGGGPPPLGLHTLMQESTGLKVKNMIDNIAADLIASVEMIAQESW